MKVIYKITYPTGKIYIGKDSVGSYRYFGSPDMDVINSDFKHLPEEIRKDYSVRKQILWESEDYNTPQKLDKGLRWMITCRNLEEGRQDEKEKKVRCDIQG